MASQIPGSLSGMDMILSITQRAINKQFELLYYTQINNSEAFLIDHTLKINYGTQGGITAWVGSPAVDFTDIGRMAIHNQSVRFILPIKGGWLDTMPRDGVTHRILFGDLKLSWMASLGSKNIDIQNLEKELIHPEASKGIRNVIHSTGVQAENFLPSSLFCLFESNQIASTFELVVNKKPHAAGNSSAAIAANDGDNPLYDLYKRDEQGNPVGLILDDLDQFRAIEAADAFKLYISYHFGNIAANPHNPYVLGYAVTQRIPAPTNALPALIPNKFIFTTTPAPAGSKDPATLNLATLNFCMLGFGHNINIINDPTAGSILVPYGQVTRQSPSTNGIFAFSRNAFCDNYIIPVLASKFKILPVAFEGKPPIESKETSTPVPSTGNRYTWKMDYKYEDHDHKEHVEWRRVTYSGTNTLDITWTSTLTNNPNAAITDDTARNMIIKIEGHVHVDIHIHTTALGIFGAKGHEGHWRDGGKYWADVDYDATLTLTTGSDGSWNFVPSVKDQVINIPRNSDGTVKYKADHHLESWVAFVDWMGNLAHNVMTSYFKDFMSLTIAPHWLEQITSALKTLNERIIMPAGDVFEFKGLDTDPTGNVYTHLMYKSNIG